MITAPAPSIPPRKDPREQALDWFMRGREGLNDVETLALQAWLKSSPTHAEAMDEWARQWEALDLLPADGVGRLRRQLAADLARAKPRSRWRKWLGSPSWATIGVPALLIVFGIGYARWAQRLEDGPLFSQAFATARGQQMTLTLPDGSHLRLDTATHGEVLFYRQRREVRLPEGQLMLEVAKDPARPLDVVAGPLRVTVLGTRFSVRYTPASSKDEQARVAVEEGHVRVTRVAPAAESAGESVELRAGQQIASDTHGHLGTVLPVASEDVAGWRDGWLSFEDTPLAQVLSEFERYGDTGLILRDHRAAEMRLTGTFNPKKLNNFRLVLPQVLPVRLRAHGDRTEIVAAP